MTALDVSGSVNVSGLTINSSTMPLINCSNGLSFAVTTTPSTLYTFTSAGLYLISTQCINGNGSGVIYGWGGSAMCVIDYSNNIYGLTTLMATGITFSVTGSSSVLKIAVNAGYGTFNLSIFKLA